EFLLAVRAVDTAGNPQDYFTMGFASNTFAVDLLPPSVSVTEPVLSPLNALASVLASASDNAGTVARVEVRISSGSGAATRYWDGDGSGTWVSFSTWVAASPLGGTDWSYAVPGGIGFISGNEYYVRVRGVDNLGNTGNAAAGAVQVSTFTWDTVDPTSTLDRINNLAPGSLVSGGAYSSILYLGGEAGDTAPGLNQGVDFYIKEGGASGSGSGIYWNGASFSAYGSPYWYPAYFSTPNYSTHTASVPWANGQRYWLRAKARDYAGNDEADGNGGTLVSVIFDTERPVSKITNVSDGSFKTGLATLNGTSSDVGTGPNPGRTDYVYLHLYREAPANLTYDWNLNDWSATSGDKEPTASDPALSSYWKQVVYEPYSIGAASGTWSLAMPNISGLSGNRFRLLVRAKDWTGNIEVNPSTVTFTLDEYAEGPPERPRGVIDSITNGVHLTSTFTTVTGYAEDNPGGKLESVMVLVSRFNSNGTTFYWTGTGWSETGVEPSPWPGATADDGTFDSIYELFTSTMPPFSEWTGNGSYSIRAKAGDVAGASGWRRPMAERSRPYSPTCLSP
ncbi:MAG TPA: hypothetical protein PL037_07375, partial [Elusimicrobiales bacterium]|nr:hypothetical protein [Elusimicrobiales bacterium]